MNHRSCQRGAATLGISALLLLAVSLAVLYANRGLIFEQRGSANQYRAMRAFEMAEAGLEWATAMLNDPRALDATCTPAAGGRPFRERYAPAFLPLVLAPVAGERPACRLDGAGLVCACVQAGEAPDLGSASEPTFGLDFAAVPQDAASVRVTAHGCTSPGEPCVPGSAETVDAEAKASAVLKLRPLLRAMPVAALTAGGAVELAQPITLSNPDVNTALLIDAGASVTLAEGTTLTGPDGTPGKHLLAAHDLALDAAARQDLFVAFFGMTAQRFSQAAPVRSVGGTTPAERAAAVLAAYHDGQVAFRLDGDVEFDAASLGMPDRPLLIVTAHRVTCSQPCRLYGLLYGEMPAREEDDLRNVSVVGAVITRGLHRQSGGGAVAYDRAVLEALRLGTAMLVRVPGSWKDY
jgi:hypothetical protein